MMMVKRCQQWIFLILFILFYRSYSQSQKRFFVRVLLDVKEAVNSKTIWTLSGAGNFTISDLLDPSKRQTIKASHVSIALNSDGGLTVNGKKVASDFIRIDSTKGNIHFGHHVYKGSMMVVPCDGTLQLINRLELEDYVDSGLAWEMLPGWPAAALESGAIAYRTYVISTVRASRARYRKLKQECWYDIHCTPKHQTYKGVHSSKSISQAVANTRGLILTFNKQPVVALYDACCGGSVPSKRAGVDFNVAPYLARSYACTACSPCKLYDWSVKHSFRDLSNLFEPFLPKKGLITDIKIGEKDKAGVVRNLKVKIKNEWFSIAMTKVQQSIKQVKSQTITLKRRGNMVTFKGKGYGHQLGFCQWGAYGLALQGWDYKAILRFYYPETTVMKIEVAE